MIIKEKHAKDNAARKLHAQLWKRITPQTISLKY